jgi:epoxide hydrolase-like predicted phosphatase
MMKDIKNLIFDFGGVLINLDRTACREAFEKLGIESIHESVLDDYRQKELYMQLESGNISAAAFRASMRRLSDQDLTDQQIDDAWVSILGDIPDYKLDWLLELRKQYHILLLSNTNSIHWQWSEQNRFHYKGHKVDDFFDRIYLSYELHMQKPDVEIFKFVLQDSMITPESTFFIDDSPANCKAAESLGIQTYCCPAGSDWTFLFK